MDVRKYSVNEIDRMRAAIVAPARQRPVTEFIDAATVEDRLRTYMLNGTEPEELEEMSRNLTDRWRTETEQSREKERRRRECQRNRTVSPMTVGHYKPF